jgi:anion-transporting  ArsA/GET3 family ATPase
LKADHGCAIGFDAVPRDFTSLLRRQLLLVTGKGGVGKSTVAAGFALASSRRGARTLFVELDRDTSLEGIFGMGGIGHTPRRVHDDLWATKVDPAEALVEFIRGHVPAGPLVRMAISGRIMSRFWRATPSASEMVSLVRLHALAEQSDGGTRRWDNVIVDLPSSGHALTMLEVPLTATALFKVGPVREEGQAIRELLANRLRTAMVWVTLPEEMPVNETIEFFPRFREKLDIALDHVVVNGVHPEVLEPGERDAFTRLRGIVAPGRRDLYNLMTCVEGLVVRGSRNREQIERLRQRIDASFLEIPQVRARGPELVGIVAEALECREARRRPA